MHTSRHPYLFTFSGETWLLYILISIKLGASGGWNQSLSPRAMICTGRFSSALVEQNCLTTWARQLHLAKDKVPHPAMTCPQKKYCRTFTRPSTHLLSWLKNSRWVKKNCIFRIVSIIFNYSREQPSSQEAENNGNCCPTRTQHSLQMWVVEVSHSHRNFTNGLLFIPLR